MSTPSDLQNVTVIVVTFNSAHCMERMGALLRDFPNVVCVDNGSEDTTAQEVATHLPHARWLGLERNLGFGAANNHALAQVQTEFALLLNPDCEVGAAETLQLIEIARQFPDAAMVAPQLVSQQKVAEVNYRWPSTRWKSSGPPAEGPACVGFICGAAMLWRMSCMQKEDWFDEQFFLYYEDDDLCLRLFQRGKCMLIAPHVHAVHRSRGSVRGKHPWRHEYVRGYHHAQSKLIFNQKHEGLDAALGQRRRLLSTTLLALPLRILLPSPRLMARMWGRLRGLIEWKNHE
jgi:N-acetylglucosaminyl-diphospho-decaprenol L-rhamnosyltransferase